MYPNSYARQPYAADPIRTDRGTEYAAFARITSGLKAADATDKAGYARARAVLDNQRLWFILAEDLMDDANLLPVELRARLIGLAEFVRKHSAAVLNGKAPVAPLIDINTSIMRGLRGDVEIAA